MSDPFQFQQLPIELQYQTIIRADPLTWSRLNTAVTGINWNYVLREANLDIGRYLSLAAQSGDTFLFQLLLNYQSIRRTMNQQLRFIREALLVAATQGHLELTQYLVTELHNYKEHEQDIHPIIVAAIQNGQVGVLNTLLTLTLIYGSNSRNILRIALDTRNLDVIRAVLYSDRFYHLLSDIEYYIDNTSGISDLRDINNLLREYASTFPARRQVLSRYPREVLRVLGRLFDRSVSRHVGGPNDFSFPETAIEKIVLYVLQHPDQLETVARENLGMYIPPHVDAMEYFLRNAHHYEVLLRRTYVNLDDFDTMTDYEIIQSTGVIIPSESREEFIDSYEDAEYESTYFIPLNNCERSDQVMIAFGKLNNYECMDPMDPNTVHLPDHVREWLS